MDKSSPVRSRLKALWVAAFLAVPIEPAYSYVCTTPPNSTVCIKWASTPVKFFINPSNVEGIPAAAIIGDLQTAAAAWSTQANINMQLVYSGASNVATFTGASDGQNSIYFMNDSPGLIAECHWWANASNNLIEADLVFHEGNMSFFTGNTGCNNNRGYGNYIQNVATHELGHALGLSHSSVASATMYATASACTTNGEVLDPDDIAGIQSVYSKNNPDSIAPEVWFISPLNGNTVSGIKTLSSYAFDNYAVTKVEYYLDNSNVPIGTATTAPFAVNWNSASTSNGSHTLIAKAYDSGNRVTTSYSPVTITVSNSAGTPPQIVLTKSSSPTGVVAGGTVTFTIQYQNTGSTNATNVVITDAIPANSTLVDGTISNGGTVSNGTITWTIGNVAAGAPSQSVSFKVTAH